MCASHQEVNLKTHGTSRAVRVSVWQAWDCQLESHCILCGPWTSDLQSVYSEPAKYILQSPVLLVLATCRPSSQFLHTPTFRNWTTAIGFQYWQPQARQHFDRWNAFTLKVFSLLLGWSMWYRAGDLYFPAGLFAIASCTARLISFYQPRSLGKDVQLVYNPSWYILLVTQGLFISGLTYLFQVQQVRWEASMHTKYGTFH